MERELIALGLRQGKSFREIGAWIGRDHSVVSARLIETVGGRNIRRWSRSAGLIVCGSARRYARC
nr:helix-turn-helix domain-containing protein [Amycolatopsis regifaucium]